MAKAQRYVSDELTHFVGRRTTAMDEKYELLVKILRSGSLTHPPHDPTSTEKSMNTNFLMKHSENQMYNTSIVCFCDIPIEDFAIHIDKYSPFGLAFKKDFLIAKGANPVFYIANNSRLQLTSPMTEHPDESIPVAPSKDLPYRRDVTRSDFFNEAIIEFNQYLVCLEILIQKGKFDLESRLLSALREYHGQLPMTTDEEKLEERAFLAALGILEVRKHIPIRQRFIEVMEFIQLHVLSYMKMFDDSKSEAHPDNYYMEREWRTIGNVNFKLDDVRRVILPELFAQRLRSDLPSYYGQVTFSE